MINRAAVLRRLSHFDAATMVDLQETFGLTDPTKRRSVWRLLNKLAADGYVEIDKSGGMPIYRVTEAGRKTA